MKIEIAKEDIWWLRHTLDHAIQYMESQPNPAAFSRCPAVARKAISKLNTAAKKAFGHNLHADAMMTAKADARAVRRKRARRAALQTARDIKFNTDTEEYLFEGPR